MRVAPNSKRAIRMEHSKQLVMSLVCDESCSTKLYGIDISHYEELCALLIATIKRGLDDEQQRDFAMWWEQTQKSLKNPAGYKIP